MTERREFALWAGLLVLARLFDIWSTWVGDPTLERELNPVVRAMGANWTFVLWYNALILGLMLLALYGALRIRRRVLPTAPIEPFLGFIGHVWLADADARWRLVWAMPRDGSRWLFMIGAFGTVALVAGSFAAGLHNLLVSNGVRTLPIAAIEATGPWLPYVVYLIPGGLIPAVLYLYRLHRRHSQGRLSGLQTTASAAP